MHALTLNERLSHAVRVRSVRTAMLAIIDELGRRLVRRRWTQLAPWYVGKTVERFGLTVVVDGIVVDVPAAGNQTFAKGLLWLGLYETLERYAVARYLSPGLPIVDLGASIGVVSCLANRRLVNRVLQTSLEANPTLIPLLQRNRDRNGCEFTVIHEALAYDHSVVDFGLTESTVASGLHAPNVVGHAQVRATSLKRILATAGFAECTLLCDVEGAEADLIDREIDVLEQHVRMLIIEFHPAILGDERVAALKRQLIDRRFAVAWQREDVVVLRHSRS